MNSTHSFNKSLLRGYSVPGTAWIQEYNNVTNKGIVFKELAVRGGGEGSMVSNQVNLQYSVVFPSDKCEHSGRK